MVQNLCFVDTVMYISRPMMCNGRNSDRNHNFEPWSRLKIEFSPWSLPDSG